MSERVDVTLHGNAISGSAPFKGALALAVGLWLSSMGCGSSLRLAPKADVPPSSTVIAVTTLPPPAPPEEIPEVADDAQLVWADGCWEWSIGRWIWVRGGWVDMPQGGAYFPGKIGVDAEGSLVWTPCTWVVSGKPVGTLIPKVPARYPASSRSVAR